MLVSAEGQVENQNEPKRPLIIGRLASFWFSTRLSRKKVIRLARKIVYRFEKKTVIVLILPVNVWLKQVPVLEHE